MGFVNVRTDIAEMLLRAARELWIERNIPPSEMASGLVLAGFTILSAGMNDEQVRAVLEQAFEMTAPIRRHTEERWKRTGFDPYKDES
jgi:hypothetical protein